MDSCHRHMIRVLAALSLSFLLAGCSSSGGSDPTGPETPDPVSVTVANASMAEGDAGAALLAFDVTISDSPETGTTISFDWTTADATATIADGDYVSASGTMSFVLGGALTQQITVTVNGDADVEDDETFRVELSNVTNAEFFDALGIGTIVNDDVAAASGDLLVDPTAPGTEDGLTWATAFHTIQAAVQSSFDVGGGEVWVAAGTYTSGSGDPAVPVISMRRDVEIYGGFEGYASGAGALETERTQRDPALNITMLDGQDVADHVVHSQSVGGTVLDGFTVTRGNADDDNGGGLYMYQSAVTVANCTFIANNAGWGGGLYVYDVSPDISDCVFQDNTARYGAGVYCYRSSSILTDCEFIDNTANNFGGGLYATDDNNPDTVPVLNGCTFSGNVATTAYGGGMYADKGSPELTACTFSTNSATTGGGIFFRDNHPVLTSCIFSENDGGVEGGAIYNYEAFPELEYCTFTDNEAGRGGGIYSSHISISTLDGCDFTGNVARGTNGGGICNSTGSVTNLADCTFTDNSAVNGGGIHNYTSASTLENCDFISNTASGMGGGVYNDYYSAPVIDGCRFSQNSAAEGGGLYNDRNSKPMITNTVFDGNTATDGGGMYNADTSHSVLANCVFTLNVAGDFGGGLYNDHSSPKLSNCILTGNTAFDAGSEVHNDASSAPSYSHCNIFGCGGSGLWGTGYGIDDGGNIAEDPLFADAAGGNFRLQAGSLCIDAGTNVDVYDIDADMDIVEVLMMAEDFYGNARFADDPATADTGSGTAPVIDMGVHEF